MKIAVLFAVGTEEIEALTPVDVLRRAGVEVDLVSVSGEFPKGSHDIIVKADALSKDVDFSQYDGLVIPGGMPGATNIASDEKVMVAISKMLKEGKLVSAICASPAVVLANNGLITGKKITCYPADVFVKMTNGCVFSGKNVEIDGNLITANGPKSAMEFAIAICNYLGVAPKF